MTGYDFHPEAELDLDEIWDFIAKDNPAAADRVTEDIIADIEALSPSSMAAAARGSWPPFSGAGSQLTGSKSRL